MRYGQAGDPLKRGRLLMAVGVLLVAGGSAADDRQLLERLRIDHAAMVSAERDFHQRRRAGNLRGAEATDYAAYVARLHRLVAEDCVALAAAGLPLPPDLGCPFLPPPALAPAAIDQAREQTVDEQIAVLDAQLLSGLGEFDEMLLREQERVRAAAPMTEATGGGAGGAGNGGASDGTEGAEGGEGTDESAGEQGAAGAEGKSGAASERGSDGSSGQGAGSGAGAERQRGRQGVPPNIPDGSDDDVVARQLREAAEKERDPELKKRLWEEYRRYKEGTR